MIEICPVILAGGSGTRLWPLSRQGYPKQLLQLRGDNTLLQETTVRLDGLNGRGVFGQCEDEKLSVADPLVVCNEEYRFLIIEQLEGIGRTPAQILLEPVGRNTAPALTIAALTAAKGGHDPVLLVMPADHVIADLDKFHDAAVAGVALAWEGMIVTFGIAPDRSETGYGYIRKGAEVQAGGGALGFTVDAFVEKPDQEKAKSYLASGDYLWNSGLYMMLASVWLDAIARHAPEISAACQEAWEQGRVDGDFYRVEKCSFEACPADSIDYAVMERLAGPSNRGCEGSPSSATEKPPLMSAAVLLDAGWSDIGAWPAVLELNRRDAGGNVLYGDVYGHRVRNSLLISRHRFLAAVGVQDIVAVETADAVLVMHKDHSQDVKVVVDWLKAAGRQEGKSHRRVYRPWGYYEQLDAGDRFQVKRLTVKPGAVLSLQMHHHRAEHWVVVRGTAKVIRADEEFLLTENQSTYISLGVKHRLENPGKVPLEVIEVQSGSYLGEDDILRFEDRYDRDIEC